MSLPVQQFLLHIPRHHHIVKGMIFIGLKVWKSPLFQIDTHTDKTHIHKLLSLSLEESEKKNRYKTPWNCFYYKILTCIDNAADITEPLYHFFACFQFRRAPVQLHFHLLQRTLSANRWCWMSENTEVLFEQYALPLLQFSLCITHLVVNRMCCHYPSQLRLPFETHVIWLSLTPLRIPSELKAQRCLMPPQRSEPTFHTPADTLPWQSTVHQQRNQGSGMWYYSNWTQINTRSHTHTRTCSYTFLCILLFIKNLTEPHRGLASKQLAGLISKRHITMEANTCTYRLHMPTR